MKLSEELYHLYDIHDPIKHDTKGLIKGWAIKAGQLEATNTELLEALWLANNFIRDVRELVVVDPDTRPLWENILTLTNEAIRIAKEK